MTHFQMLGHPARNAFTGLAIVVAACCIVNIPIASATTLTVGRNVDTSVRTGNESEGAIAIEIVNMAAWRRVSASVRPSGGVSGSGKDSVWQVSEG